MNPSLSLVMCSCLAMSTMTHAFAPTGSNLLQHNAYARPAPRRSLGLCMQAADRMQDDVSSRLRRTLLQTAAVAPLLLVGAHESFASKNEGELVLVVGGSGGIGQFAIYDLLQRGYKVRSITRKPEKVKEAVKNTELEKVEWVAGDLNDKSTIAPTMTGVKMVIFAAGAHGWEDIENNRRIYAEAVGEIARVGAASGVDRIVLVSSAGLNRIKPNYSEYLKDVLFWQKSLNRIKPNYSEYLKDVLFWKLRGEQLLKASGVNYSIVRAYSLNNQDDDVSDKFTVAVLQGDPEGISGLITRKDLGEVAVEALLGEKTKNASFEVINARKNFMGVERDWRKSLLGLVPDAPLSQEDLAAAKAGAGADKGRSKGGVLDPSFYGDPSKGFRN